MREVGGGKERGLMLFPFFAGSVNTGTISHNGSREVQSTTIHSLALPSFESSTYEGIWAKPATGRPFCLSRGHDS